MSNQYISGRGSDHCRGCNGSNLFSALDLGHLPLANELWAEEVGELELFPLHLRICNSCGLGQVEDCVTPDRLFSDYRYLSSVSISFVKHAREYVDLVVEKFNIGKGDWVLEIASNDGYLLQHFLEKGIRVLGIEPAQNIANVAVKIGVDTISRFFSLELAQEILTKMGHPRLIIANNVLAHVPNLQDFVAGLAIIAGPETLVSVENPSLMNFLEGGQFDTIYHEHYSYLTVHSVSMIIKPFGLEVFDVERIETHGGSNRYWLRTQNVGLHPEETVNRMIQDEISKGLFKRRNGMIFHKGLKPRSLIFRIFKHFTSTR